MRSHSANQGPRAAMPQRRGLRSIRRGTVLLVGLIALVMSSTACEPAPPPVITPPPPPRPAVPIGAPPRVLKVDVIGDSLVRQAGPNIQAALAGAGLAATVASQPGVDLMNPFIQDNIAAVAARPGDIVVLATASNDVQWQWKNVAALGQAGVQRTYRQNLGRAIDQLRDRCVVVVNSRENMAPMFNPQQAMVLNANLREEGQVRRNMVIIDWAGASRSHTDDWFVGDQLHFGPDANTSVGTRAGAAAYASAVTYGVNACRNALDPA